MSNQAHREPAKLHYRIAETGRPACGAGHGRWVATTTEPRRVDCQRCRRMLRGHKGLAIAKGKDS
jgi:hypothetical protein